MGLFVFFFLRLSTVEHKNHTKHFAFFVAFVQCGFSTQRGIKLKHGFSKTPRESWFLKTHITWNVWRTQAKQHQYIFSFRLILVKLA
jgi:hypothetical protein